ncbi:MAG TPA: hypothetical protein DD670_17930 [Planctomycetaceae bacterium]|nr:hypothetical protein [Planctomycetaceae bacterium]
MNACESPIRDSWPSPTRKAPRSWYFALRFAVVGFVLAGIFMICLGYRQFDPPPPPPQPPNVAYCGNEVLGSVVRRTARGLLIMAVGAPIAAVAGGLIGGITGGAVDCVSRFYRRSSESKRA